MDFYTKKWKEYIYTNYRNYVIDDVSNPIMDDFDFNVFKEKNMEDAMKLAREYAYQNILNKDSNNLEELEVLIKKRFNNYYEAKKKYVASYDYLKKEFGKYEEVTLLDYDTEFTNYKERMDDFVNKYKGVFGVKDEDLDVLYYLSLRVTTPKFMKIFNECDRNKIPFPIKSDVNAFLSSYDDYLVSKKENVPYNSLIKYNETSGSCCFFDEYNVLDYIECDNDVIVKLGKHEEDKIIDVYDFIMKNAKLVKTDRYICVDEHGPFHTLKENGTVADYLKEIIFNGFITAIEGEIYEDTPLTIYINFDYGYHKYEYTCSDIEVKKEQDIVIKRIANSVINEVKYINDDLVVKMVDIEGKKYVINIDNPVIVTMGIMEKELLNKEIHSIKYYKFNDGRYVISLLLMKENGKGDWYNISSLNVSLK